MNILDEIYALKDEKYAKFQGSLVPNINKSLIIGARIPLLRKLAKKLTNDEKLEFMGNLAHKFYDENILHAILLSQISDFDFCVKSIDKFLPYIDNWAVCDIISPKIFAKNTATLITKVEIWSNSNAEFACRFGIIILMRYFLNENFKEKYLEIPRLIKCKKYYANMAVAWFYATALAKKWDISYEFVKYNRFDKYILNKIIQKACESRQISPKKREILKQIKA